MRGQKRQKKRYDEDTGIHTKNLGRTTLEVDFMIMLQVYKKVFYYNSEKEKGREGRP